MEWTNNVNESMNQSNQLTELWLLSGLKNPQKNKKNQNQKQEFS